MSIKWESLCFVFAYRKSRERQYFLKWSQTEFVFRQKRLKTRVFQDYFVLASPENAQPYPKELRIVVCAQLKLHL